VAWESRWNKRFYYRSRRVGNRVVKTYFGRGRQALAAAQEDQEKQAARAARRYAAEIERAVAEPARELIAELDGEVRIVIQTALAKAGYRQHARGRWRKMRATTQEESRQTTSRTQGEEREVACGLH
jgi:hypothetical protein